MLRVQLGRFGHRGWAGSRLGYYRCDSQQRDESHDAAIRPGHRRRRAFGLGRGVAGRADRRQSSRPGQGRVPARQAVRRRPDRPRGELSAEDGPGRRGLQVPPGQPGDGVQPQRNGSCRSRSGPACPITGTPSAAPSSTPLLLKHAESAGAEVRQGAEVTGPGARRQRPRRRRGAQERREGVRRRGHRGRRRLLPHQAGAEDRLGVQRLLGDRDPLGDARQPPRLRQPRHLPEAGVPGRPAARLRLGVPDGQRRVQHRPRLRQQLQELAVDQRHPVPRRVPADAAAASGSCRRSRS